MLNKIVRYIAAACLFGAMVVPAAHSASGRGSSASSSGRSAGGYGVGRSAGAPATPLVRFVPSRAPNSSGNRVATRSRNPVVPPSNARGGGRMQAGLSGRFNTRAGSNFIANPPSRRTSTSEFNWAGRSSGGLLLFRAASPRTPLPKGASGDHFLYLPNQGNARANWRQNSSRLRLAMSQGRPIYDLHTSTNGDLIRTGGFLNAERNLLSSRGWRFDPSRRAWLPPK